MVGPRAVLSSPASRFLRAAPLVALVLASAAHAGPYTVEECVAASEAGQQAHRKGQFFLARSALERCADASCPAVVQGECTKELTEVIATMPTIVVVVRRDGVDQPGAQVSLDGKPWLTSLTGRAEDVEPGEHRVTVDAAGQRLEQTLVFNVAEKNRLVVFQLAGSTPVPEPVPQRVTIVAPEVASSRSPVAPSVLTALAVAGAAGFAGFGWSGKSRLDQLESAPCAVTKTCNPATVADIRQRFLLADVSAGVGVLSALAAAWQWWAFATAPTSAPQVVVAPFGPAGLSVLGRF